MTPLERAARDLWKLDGFDPDAHPHIRSGDPLLKAYEDRVRAVLQAIREPSRAMISDGAFQIFRGQRITEDDLDSAKRVWRGMIGAALEEK